MTRENLQIPYQIQQLLDAVTNTKDSVHVRTNYAMRLRTIQAEIDKALASYESETRQVRSSKEHKEKYARVGADAMVRER